MPEELENIFETEHPNKIVTTNNNDKKGICGSEENNMNFIINQSNENQLY